MELRQREYSKGIHSRQNRSSPMFLTDCASHSEKLAAVPKTCADYDWILLPLVDVLRSTVGSGAINTRTAAWRIEPDRLGSKIFDYGSVEGMNVGALPGARPDPISLGMQGRRVV